MPAAIAIVALAALLNAFTGSGPAPSTVTAPQTPAPTTTANPAGDSSGGGMKAGVAGSPSDPQAGQPGTFGH